MRAVARSLALPVVAAAAMTLFATAAAVAQFGGGAGGFFGGVGGISIDAAGIVRNVDGAALEALAETRRAALANNRLPAAAGELRKVSLARVVAAVREAAAGKPLPADVALLGGLERITHVFVDPERHDIVLAGPADAAVVGPVGTIVAATSRRPLLQLEDLITALRAIDGARQGGMRCSIDPTPEGIARVQRFLAERRTIGPDPQAVFRGMEEALGPTAASHGCSSRPTSGSSGSAWASSRRVWPACRAISPWCRRAARRRRCRGSGSRPNTTRSPATPTSSRGGSRAAA
jgi:hypothetical protein